jgi:hypothetical protein
MAVIAAGVVNKAGRILVVRCFMDVTRIRIEGLLSAFPKLLGSGSKQTTFIDSGSVRYLYQPVEGMYLVTVTTKTSNIMEDLATLRTLGRVLPEYCNPITEESVVAKAFEIMFAMDEIITNGAREATTMEQVLSALEMRSEAEERARREHEVKEKDAKKVAKAKAKEMKQKRMDGDMYGGSSSHSGGGGGGGASAHPEPAGGYGRFSETASAETETKAPAKKLGGGGMSLSNKRKQDTAAKVFAETGGTATTKAPAPTNDVAAPAHDHPVNIRVEEQISVALNRDGGVSSAEVKGVMAITVSDPDAALVRIHLDPLREEFTFKTHPNINKQLFTTDNILAIKDSKAYPTQATLEIVRWRASSLGKLPVPLSINCWPSESGATIEFELENRQLVLENVVVMLPLAGAFPTVNEMSTGEYTHDSGRSTLQWRIGRVDANESSGSMEITLDKPVGERAFFPASVSFRSLTALSQVNVRDVVHVETGRSVNFAFTVSATTEDYSVN